MPRNFDGVIEITLQGPAEAVGVKTSVASTIENIKDVWLEYVSPTDRDRDIADLCCIFDGFLLENSATLVGLGVVGGDTILVFPRTGSLPQLGTLTLKKRSAEEISVGLNVLFGEEEKLQVLPSNVRHYGPLYSEKMLFFNNILDKDVEDILLTYDKSVRNQFDLNKVREWCLAHIYDDGNELRDLEICELLPDSDDAIVNDAVEQVFYVLRDFRNKYWALPDSRNIKYDSVFIGPERNANFTNYLAFPPTVQLSGVDWTTSLRDLMDSYREYSNFNIPNSYDYLYFNNEVYFLDERVYDVYINSLSNIPFLPAHQHFSFQFDISATEDLRCIDDLVSFIEGGEDFGSESKKKKKKRKKKGQQDDSKDSVSTSDPTKLVDDTKINFIEEKMNIGGQDEDDEDLPNESNVSNRGKTAKTRKLCKKADRLELRALQLEQEAARLETHVEKITTVEEIKGIIEREINLENKKLEENQEEEDEMMNVKERDENLILNIRRTDTEITNITNGISSCDSQIFDLELRLKKVNLLRSKLIERQSEKYEKLKSLEEEKRGLTQKINSKSLNFFEGRSRTLRRLEELESLQDRASLETEEYDGSGPCPPSILEFLDSEIQWREEQLACDTSKVT